jgi:2-polyprenyl-6-methoxyphenol hydroxylase-like FAD-dependent oxidoreductase
VQRIAIIGAGISGLAVTHALINRVNAPLTTNLASDDSHGNTNNYCCFDTIDLFDARDNFDHTAGAGIQLNGGLSILGRINPSLQRAVYEAGMPQTQIQSRTNPYNGWFSSTNSNPPQQKRYDTLLQLDLKDVVQTAGGKVAEALLLSQTQHPPAAVTTAATTNNTPVRTSKPPSETVLLWISIMRGALQRVLFESLPATTTSSTRPQQQVPWRLQFQKKLINIRTASSTTSSITTGSEEEETVVYCQFEDGTESGPYDLIIGCEGINSKVKQYIELNQGKQIATPLPTATTKSVDNLLNTAIYSGLRIRYAVADGTSNNTVAPSSFLPVVPTAKLTQYFGNGAYALHGTYGAGINQPNTQCAFIVYLDENYIGPFQRKKVPANVAQPPVKSPSPTIGENADWTQDQRRTVQVARENMLQQLESCQIPKGDKDYDVLRETIQNANRFFELGSYYHNPFGSWSCTVSSTSTSRPAHVVLCGDAAHALPPFLGQGSNQAIQDAYCLAEKIVQYNTQITVDGATTVTLRSLLDDYQKVRWLPCFEIFWKAAFLGYLETGGVNGFYSKFRDVFFKSMGMIGVASRVLLNAATPKV